MSLVLTLSVVYAVYDTSLSKLVMSLGATVRNADVKSVSS
jgi:hypothetical protein